MPVASERPLAHPAPKQYSFSVPEFISRGRALWSVVALGAVLRLAALGHKSFWLDEITSVAIVQRPGAAFWHFLWHEEGNMAMYYVLLRPWLHFGSSEAVARLLSVLPGVLSIPLMYLLGQTSVRPPHRNTRRSTIRA
jgi:uncharacterized membrane protein